MYYIIESKLIQPSVRRVPWLAKNLGRNKRNARHKIAFAVLRELGAVVGITSKSEYMGALQVATVTSKILILTQIVQYQDALIHNWLLGTA